MLPARRQRHAYGGEVPYRERERFQGARDHSDDRGRHSERVTGKQSQPHHNGSLGDRNTRCAARRASEFIKDLHFVLILLCGF